MLNAAIITLKGIHNTRQVKPGTSPISFRARGRAKKQKYIIYIGYAATHNHSHDTKDLHIQRIKPVTSFNSLFIMWFRSCSSTKSLRYFNIAPLTLVIRFTIYGKKCSHFTKKIDINLLQNLCQKLNNINNCYLLYRKNEKAT